MFPSVAAVPVDRRCSIMESLLYHLPGLHTDTSRVRDNNVCFHQMPLTTIIEAQYYRTEILPWVFLGFVLAHLGFFIFLEWQRWTRVQKTIYNTMTTLTNSVRTELYNLVN